MENSRDIPPNTDNIKHLGHFRKLKKYLFNHILMYLSLNQVLQIKNKEVYSIVFSNKAKFAKECLARELEALFAINMPIEPDVITNLAFSILSGRPSIIPILGYMATGSFQNKNKFYHYTNLFKLNTEFHCSDYGNTANNKYYGALVYKYYYPQPFFLIENDLEYIKHRQIPQLAEKLTNKDEIVFTIMREDVQNLCLSQASTSYFQKTTQNYSDPLWKFASDFNSIFPTKDSAYSSLPCDGKSLFDDSSVLDELFDSRGEIPNYTFYLTNIYIDNDWGYTCPIKTFALFTHDQRQLNENDNYFLSLFNGVDSSEKVRAIAKIANLTYQERLFPYQTVAKNQYNSWEDEEDFDTFEETMEVTVTTDLMIEFNPCEQINRNLRIVCWGYLPLTACRAMNFAHLTHCGKYIVMLFISTNCTCRKTADCSKFLLFGNMVRYL